MSVSKLFNNEKEAVADALACVMTVKLRGGEVGDSTINTLRAMLGLEPKEYNLEWLEKDFVPTKVTYNGVEVKK